MRPALLCIDMQEHFRDGMAAAVVGRLNNLIDVCRRLHITIIFTQHGHPLLDPEAEERSSVLVRWWGADGSIRHGSHAWQLLPELHVKPGEDPIISTKQTYDAFQVVQATCTLL